MESQDFLEAAHQLLEFGQRGRTTVICAEALPERCHRRLISERLLVRGIPVVHVLTANRVEHHQLTPFARVVDERIVYDGGQAELFGYSSRE